MFDRKAQAALEYLMTYGWALVVIVIVVAALIFLINPSQIGTSGCTGFEKLPIKNYAVSGTTLTVLATNQTGQKLTDVNALDANATIGGTLYQSLTLKLNGSTTPSTGADTINANADIRLEYTFGATISGGYDVSLLIKYKDKDGFSRTTTASCKGTA